MTGMDRMPWIRGLLAVTVSLVCVVPGGAARSEKDRSPGPAGCCDKSGTFAVRFTVKVDPANHHAVIQLTDGRIVIVRLSDGTFDVRGNRSAIIRATTEDSPSNCGFPLANGTGTVAGFPNVTGRYKELEIAGDAIQGLLELGVAGELPTGQAICYEFSGTRDPTVPDPGAAVLEFAVQFTLKLIRFSPTKPRPGFFFGIGQGVPSAVHGRFVYAGDATGGLVPAGQLPITAAHEPLASVPLDRPGGGAQDIAMISRDPAGGAATLNYFARTTGGTFDRRQTLTLAAEYTTGDVFVAAGDLTGDGASEIVTASGSGRVDTYRYGSGAFTLSQTLDLGLPTVGLLPELVDLDGDGARDAALTSQQLEQQALFMSILRGDGEGSLTPGPATSDLFCLDSLFASPFRVLTGDVNADGLLDLIFGGQGGNCPVPDAKPIVVTLLNQPGQPGSFTSQPPFEVPTPFSSDTFQLTLFTPPCAGTPALIANGGVFVGTGTGGFVDSGVRLALDGVAPESVLAADVNLDGIVDLTAFYSTDGQLTIQTLSLGELAPRPVITSVSVVGKNLVVDGSGFTAGSQILVDGVAYKTKADRSSPETRLTSKKALKKIPAGTEVTVQVQTADGVVSDGRIFQRS